MPLVKLFATVRVAKSSSLDLLEIRIIIFFPISLIDTFTTKIPVRYEGRCYENQMIFLLFSNKIIVIVEKFSARQAVLFLCSFL